MLLASNLKFLISAYLSVECLSNVGPPNMVAALVSLLLTTNLPSPAATALGCIAFTAPNNAYEMACVVLI